MKGSRREIFDLATGCEMSAMPKPLEHPLILFSGMGADARLLKRQVEAFPELTVPAWIPPRGDESLADYARRFAEVIDPGGPCRIGGVSFGGIVALEVSRHLEARGCFLIASVRHPSQLPWRLRIFHPLALAPPPLAQMMIRGFAKSVEISLGWRSRQTTRNFVAQLQQADAEFLRWAARAVMAWKPQSPLLPPHIPIHQIHGSRDHVFPVTRSQAQTLLPDAGHLMTLTHAGEVNAFLRRSMATGTLT